MQLTQPQLELDNEATRPEAMARKLGLTSEQFQAILEPLTAESEGSRTWLADRVLARACALGYESAWQYFIATYESRLQAMAMRLTRDPNGASELVADLYGDLYGIRRTAAPTAAGEERLSSKFRHYSGRGPLLGWLRALLAQMRVNQIRCQRPQISLEDAPLAAHAVRATEFDGDGPLLRQMSEPLDFALAAVLEALPPRDCTLLALYFLDHQTLAAIGELYGVHEATISRRLSRLLRGLRRELRKELLAQRCSLRQIEELMNADVRDIPSRFRSLLKRWSSRQRPDAESEPTDALKAMPSAGEKMQAGTVAAFSKATTQQPDRRERPTMPFGLSRS